MVGPVASCEVAGAACADSYAVNTQSAFMLMRLKSENGRRFATAAQRLLELVPPELDQLASPMAKHLVVAEKIGSYLSSGEVLDFGSGSCLKQPGDFPHAAVVRYTILQLKRRALFLLDLNLDAA